MLNEITRMQQLAGILKENAQAISPSDIKVGAIFTFTHPTLKEEVTVVISQIKFDHNGEDVRYEFKDRISKGPYSLGNKIEAAKTLNKYGGKKVGKPEVVGQVPQ